MTSERTKAEEMYAGLNALHLELPDSVANDVTARVMARVEELESACRLAEKCLIDLAPYSPEVAAAVVAIVEIVHDAITPRKDKASR